MLDEFDLLAFLGLAFDVGRAFGLAFVGLAFVLGGIVLVGCVFGAVDADFACPVEVAVVVGNADVFLILSSYC